MTAQKREAGKNHIWLLHEEAGVVHGSKTHISTSALARHARFTAR